MKECNYKKQGKMDKMHEREGEKKFDAKHKKVAKHLEKAAKHHDKMGEALAHAHEAAAGHKYDESKKHREREAKGMRKVVYR